MNEAIVISNVKHYIWTKVPQTEGKSTGNSSVLLTVLSNFEIFEIKLDSYGRFILEVFLVSM